MKLQHKMKIKTLFLVLFAALFISLASISALTLTASDTTISVSSLSDSPITLTITGDESFNMTLPSLTINGVSFPIQNTTSILNTNSATLAISVPSAFLSTVALGNSTSGTLTITAVNSSNVSRTASKTITVNIEDNTKCTANNPGSLEITDMNFDVIDGFGSDGDWYPLDNVEASFTVNTGAYDVREIKITACLMDLTTNRCKMTEKDMDISTNSFKVDSDDNQDVTLKFNVDPDKLKVGNTNYRLYVTATGKVHTDSSNVINGNSTCITGGFNEPITITTDDSFIIIPDSRYNAADSIVFQETATCGSDIDTTFDLWNVGSEDFNSDEVFLKIYNSELKINKDIDLTEDLNSMSKQEMSTVLSIPKNAVAKTYSIEFTVFDDSSRGDDDIYQNSNDDKAKYYGLLKVEPCTAPASASITAVSETPTAIIGNPLIIEATIKNTGTSSTTYTMGITGNTEWSTLAQIDPPTFTLAAGNSQKVNIYLDINPDAAEGAKEFTITATSGTTANSYTLTGLTLKKGLSSQALINHFKNNWFIYVIVLINIILIIAIIIALRSAMRK